MSLFKNNVTETDHTSGNESRAFFSHVCRSFSSPPTFLMIVFCFYLAMFLMMLAALFLMVFFMTASRFVCPFPLRLCFLLTN
jgi:hypothetical protein